MIKLSLVISIAGLLILFFISEKIRPKEYQINLLSKENLEQLIKIKGIYSGLGKIVFDTTKIIEWKELSEEKEYSIDLYHLKNYDDLLLGSFKVDLLK